jgi:hypothetical protein
MSGNIEWVAVKKWKPEPIGAVGFMGNSLVAIVAFYADEDANQDGKVSWTEWAASKVLFDLSGKAVTEVAMQARVEPDILLRDQEIDRMAKNMFVNFASGLAVQGVYKVYFSRGVGMVGSAVARKITADMVKQLVIRKGFEAAVKRAFMAAASV